MTSTPADQEAGKKDIPVSENQRSSTEFASSGGPGGDRANSASPAPDGQQPDVLENVSEVVSGWQSWLADLCDLFVAESRLALTLFTAWCVLSLLLVLTLFLALISAIGVVGLILFDLSILDPVDLAALALASTLAFSLVIIVVIRSLSNRMFLNATVQQIKDACSRKEGPGGGTDRD